MKHALVTGGAEKSEIDGQFIRKHNQWSLKNFNDGYVDGKGRFRVYFPDHPRADPNEGYVLREIVAYEAYHLGSVVPLSMEVHHKDENILNDTKDNLELLTKREHRLEHARRNGQRPERVCKQCGKTFEINKWRLKNKKENRGTYCSQECYKLMPKSEQSKRKQSESLKKAYSEGRR